MDGDTSPLRFGDFTLEPGQRRLIRGGREVELGSRYFDALALLLRERGTLVTKERFMAEVWRGIPVTDEALTQCIRTLRRALGDDAVASRFIATVPKHGYRFIAEVSVGGVAHTPTTVRLRDPSGPMVLAGALGGTGAGALGGLVYGILSVMGGVAGASTVLVLAALGALLGLAGGAGVALGIAAARLWLPRRRAVVIPGAALGGAAVGALGAGLGRDGVVLMTGTMIDSVTGPLEGTLLGAAAGAATVVAGRSASWPHALAAGTLTGALAGVAINLVGGRMLGGTLLLLERGVPQAQLALGEMLRGTEPVLAPAEAALFVMSFVVAQRLFQSRP